MSTTEEAAIKVLSWTAAEVEELARKWASDSDSDDVRFISHEAGEMVVIAPYTHGWGGVRAGSLVGEVVKTVAEKAAVRYYDGPAGPYWADKVSYFYEGEGGGVLFTDGFDYAAGLGGGRTFHCWGENGRIFKEAYRLEQRRLVAVSGAEEAAAKRDFGRTAYRRLVDLYGSTSAQAIINTIGPGRVDRYIELRQEAEAAISESNPSCGAATRWRKAMREDEDLYYGKGRRVAALKRHFAELLGGEVPEPLASFIPRAARDADLFEAVLASAVASVCPPRKH